MATLRPSIKNFVYFLNEKDHSRSSESRISNEKLTQILKALAKHALKEKTPSVHDLERALQGIIQEPSSESQRLKGTDQEMDLRGSNKPIAKYLRELGYIKDDKKWLTNKAFFEIGQRMLEDVIKAISEGGFGFHEASSIGSGNTILDTTRKLEVGDEIKNLDVPGTILNCVQRTKGKRMRVEFPPQLEIEDYQKFETKEELKVEVDYCIDLSSTMKYYLRSGEGSRIEAAKKALWALYVLNKKFFRSEEHTSELQSLRHLVCRLLLE